MKSFLVFCISIVLFYACSSHEPVQVISKNTRLPKVELEWAAGEKVELKGTIWPSRAHTKYYIDTEDGKSAHLKSDLIDKLEAGTELYLIGTVEYVNDIGTAGASRVKHSQTYFFVNVTDYEIVNEDE